MTDTRTFEAFEERERKEERKREREEILRRRSGVCEQRREREKERRREGERERERKRPPPPAAVVTAAMELHTVPGFNRTEEEGYTFQDDGSSAEVRVSLPPSNASYSTSDLQVSTTETTLSVTVAGETLVDCDDLWGAIRPLDTTWTLDRNSNEVVVYLSKVRKLRLLSTLLRSCAYSPPPLSLSLSLSNLEFFLLTALLCSFH